MAFRVNGHAGIFFPLFSPIVGFILLKCHERNVDNDIAYGIKSPYSSIDYYLS